MGKKQREMSEYEYSQADKFIPSFVFQIWKGLGLRRMSGNCFSGIAEVRKDICEIYNRNFYGCGPGNASLKPSEASVKTGMKDVVWKQNFR